MHSSITDASSETAETGIMKPDTLFPGWTITFPRQLILNELPESWICG
jgi:hypothetical protein